MIAEFWHPWVAVGVTLLVFVGMQMRRGGVPTDLLFVAALMVVTLAGVLTPDEALAGFADPAVAAIAGLLIVASGLRSTGLLDWVGRKLLGTARSARVALLRLAPLLVAASAFMLNTALVAMMMPVLLDWSRSRNVSPARLLMPLSYLVILGGVCTLIGTSTTLVANGILRKEHAARLAELPPDATPAARAFVHEVRPLGMFEIGAVGLPCAVAGTLLLLLFGERLFPRRRGPIEQLGEQRREYLVEMLVRADCPLIGSTVEKAGLRHLPGLFLIEIDRGGELITPVTPEDRIEADDRLVFTGVVSTIVDLERIPGLIPAADLSYELHPTRRQRRHLTEVVLSRTSPLIGTTIRDGNFRQRYNAAVVAVHRNGVRLTNKIGNIRLEPGDTLLLQTRTEFVRTYRNSRDFYLVSAVEGSEPRRHHKMFTATLLAALLIGWLSVTSWLGAHTSWPGLASPAVAALTIAVLMILTRCVRVSEARQSLELQTLVTVAAALGLGKALTSSGAARSIAWGLVTVVGEHPLALLIMVYVLTVVFTETITNTAVAAMLLPIAIAVAGEAGLNPRPFAIAITLAASLSFLTPIGYQTNLMVQGPGGYRPRDFFRAGLPLAVIVALTAWLLIPQLWSLSLESGAAR